MKLVDSSLLVDYARGDPDAIGYLDAHDTEVIGASTIVLSELYRGVMLTRDATRSEATSRYEWVTPVPFTNDIAATAADVFVDLREDGAMIDRSDIYIAATALSLDVPLVSADDHFDAVGDLTVEDYRNIT